MPTLLAAVIRLIQLASLALTGRRPSCVAWLPQLRHCSVRVNTSAQLAQLEAAVEAFVTEAAVPPQLHSLALTVWRSATLQWDQVPALPGLARLPSLRRLVRTAK